jgi:uncharacterized protein (DUF697 family)
MLGMGKLSHMWRIVREVNLEAIRRDAETPVRLLVAAESLAEAERFAALVAGPEWSSDPWLVVTETAALSGSPAVASGFAPTEIADGVFAPLAILIAPDPGFSPALATARGVLATGRVPVVSIVTGAQSRRAGRPGRGELARISVSALDEKALGPIARTLMRRLDGDVRVALARQYPVLRTALVPVLIDETARANASYALSTGLAESVPLLTAPLNLGDILILTKNQIVMSYRIALAAGKQGRPRDVVGELLGVLGGGLLFRQIARELIGLVPVLGIIPKVAVAYAGTWAIGRTVTLWATEGQKITRRSFKVLYRRGLNRGREVAREMTTKDPAA